MSIDERVHVSWHWIDREPSIKMLYVYIFACMLRFIIWLAILVGTAMSALLLSKDSFIRASFNGKDVSFLLKAACAIAKIALMALSLKYLNREWTKIDAYLSIIEEIKKCPLQSKRPS